MPQVRLIIMCHKMVIFLSTYRFLSRLVFTNDPCFLRKNNFKGKTNAFCNGEKHKTFSVAKQAGKIDRIVYIFFIFQRKLNRKKTVQSFSVQLYGRDLISALSYVAKYTQLET